MTYWGNGRNRFQIEIPISAISNLNLGDYELTSQRKGVRRYTCTSSRNRDDAITFSDTGQRLLS